MAYFQMPTTKVAMFVLASFPPMVARILGEPIFQELIRVQDTYLLPCAQSHVTTISALNLLHLCIQANIYTQYANEAYPLPHVDPGNWGGAEENTALGRQAAKAVWDQENTNFWDTVNMNRALVNRFLALLDPAIVPVQSFQSALLKNPNMVFGRVFQWFLERYGHSNEAERFEN